LRKKVLLNRRIPVECYRSYTDRFDFVYPENEAGVFSPDELKKHIKQCDALVLTLGKCPREIIEAAGDNLKAIANFGAGYDNIDVAYATERGIAVYNAPNAVTTATAELAVGLIFSALRRLPFYDHKVRTEQRCNQTFLDPQTMTLMGKTLGVIGLGRIGRSVVSMLRGMELNVLYHNTKPLPKELEEKYNATYVPFDELLSRSDIVTLHVPLNDRTRRLISYREFELMKNSAYLVNVARGAVVHEEALIDALANKKIMGASIDVYEYEPVIAPQLLELDNVSLSPHMGTLSLDIRIRQVEEALSGIWAHFCGEKPYNLVNPDYAARR